MKRLFLIKASLKVFILLVLSAASYLAYVFVSFKRLPAEMNLSTAKEIQNIEKEIMLKKPYKILTFNIGFGAYERDFSFFMNGGKYSRAKSIDSVNKNISSISSFIKNEGADFFILQEADLDGTRSYHIDEVSFFEKEFPSFDRCSAIIYDSPYLLYPITSPHGKNKSAISCFSRTEIEKAVRKSLPISGGFSKVADLDRCFTVSYMKTENQKELCIYNVHLSAYDMDGSVRDRQLEMLFTDMENELQKGNYVICGGDFNHSLRNEHHDEPYWSYPFDRNKIPSGFTFCIDDANKESIKTETCRDTNEPYSEKTTKCLTLDGFIISRNVMMNDYKHVDLHFENSDHNPVEMIFSLL